MEARSYVHVWLGELGYNRALTVSNAVHSISTSLLNGSWWTATQVRH